MRAILAGVLTLAACSGARQPPLEVGDGLLLEAGALAVDARRAAVVDAPCRPGEVLVRRGTEVGCDELDALSPETSSEELDRIAADLTAIDEQLRAVAPPSLEAKPQWVPGTCPQHREVVRRGSLGVGADGRVTPTEAGSDSPGGYCLVRLGPSGAGLRKLVVDFIDPDGIDRNATIDVQLVQLSPGGAATTIGQVEPGNLRVEEATAGRAIRQISPLDPSTKTYAIEYSLRWVDPGRSGPPTLLSLELTP